MGIVEGTYWKLICDDCESGEGFTAEGLGYTVAESEAEARSAVEDHEGRIDADGKVICRGCIEEAEDEGAPS